MAIDYTDRRRFLLAALATVVALPALWWVNRDDGSARPTTASVGVEVEASAASVTSPDPSVTVASTIGRSNIPTEPTVLDALPIFLDGPESQPGGVSEIAVPNTDAARNVVTKATFGQFPGSGACLARNIATGETITVVNLDNNRSITCSVVAAPATQSDDLVIRTDQFNQLADLTDAPIPVQIRF